MVKELERYEASRREIEEGSRILDYVPVLTQKKAIEVLEERS